MNVLVIAANKWLRALYNVGHFPIRGDQMGASDANPAVSVPVIFRLALSGHSGRFGSAPVRAGVNELNGERKAKPGERHFLDLFRQQIDRVRAQLAALSIRDLVPSYLELPAS